MGLETAKLSCVQKYLLESATDHLLGERLGGD